MTRRSTFFFAAMALLVLSFAVWGVSQARAVYDNRELLEERVGWLGSIQPTISTIHETEDSAEARTRWVEGQAELLSTLDDIDEAGAGLHTGAARAALAALDEDAPTHAQIGAVIEALALLQSDIRDQSRVISVRLSRYWSLLNILLASSILLSVLGLGLLLVLLRRQTALALAHAALSGESSRRAQASAALRSSEHALATILESIDEGIVTVDSSGLITRLNAAAERIIGCQRLSVEGARLGDVVQLRSRREVLDLSTDRLREGAVWYAADGVRLHRSDGGRIDVAVFCAPLGERPGALLLLRDITEELATEQEQRQSERTVALSRLVAGISHGLNNPLTALQSNLDSLELPPGSDEVLDDMRAGVAQMIKVLRQISALSRVTPRQLERLSVGALAEQVARIIAPEIAERAQLRLSIQPAPEVIADRARLEQALLGMVFNAAQSIPAGSAEENTVTLQVSGNTDVVEVCVTDTGADVGGVERVAVFNPFFSTRTLSTGLGLGLTYAHAEVSALNGRLAVQQTDSGGTCIRISLPAADHTEAPELPHGLRLLVIDDEASILTVIRRMLRDRFEVVGTTSGREGLQMMQTGAFDVALCDLMIPDMTGMQIHAVLSEVHPELARRMAFMTGGAFNEVSRVFLDQHEAVSLTKPFTVEALVSVLSRAVKPDAAR